MNKLEEKKHNNINKRRSICTQLTENKNTDSFSYPKNIEINIGKKV